MDEEGRGRRPGESNKYRNRVKWRRESEEGQEMSFFVVVGRADGFTVKPGGIMWKKHPYSKRGSH